jgi:hypothetical protein
MAGNKGCRLRQGLAAVTLDHAQHGKRYGHEGRLGIFSQCKLFGCPLEHELGQAMLEGLVHLVQHIPGAGEGGGQILAHTNELAALPGEDEGANDH